MGKYWMPSMSAIGYEGSYVARYCEQYPKQYRRPPSEYRNMPSDGCAIFARSDRLRIGRAARSRFAELTGVANDSGVVLIVQICDMTDSATTAQRDFDEDEGEE